MEFDLDSFKADPTLHQLNNKSFVKDTEELDSYFS